MIRRNSILQLVVNSLKALWQDESGQDVIEYALLAALVALTAVSSMHAFGKNMKKDYTTIGTDFAKQKKYKG